MARVTPPNRRFQERLDEIKANRPDLVFLVRRTLRQIADDPFLNGNLPLPFHPQRSRGRMYPVPPDFTIIYSVSDDGNTVEFLDIWY